METELPEITVGPVEGSEATPTSDAGMSDMDILENALKGTEGADGGSQEHTDDAAADVEEEPVEEGADTEEEPETEDEPEEEPPAEEPKKKTNGDASKEDEISDDEFGSNLTIHALNQRIGKSPELKALIEKDPNFKSQLFYTARKAERANQYDELFQTPALAKAMKETADRAYESNQLFNGNDSNKFLQSLAFEKDDQGRVKLDSNQMPITSPQYTQHMEHYRSVWYSSVENAAKNMVEGRPLVIDGVEYSGADILEAVNILKAVTEGPASRPTSAATVSKDLPADVRAQLDELAQLKASREKNDNQSFEEFRHTTDVDGRAAIEAQVKATLSKRLPDNSAYNDYQRGNIVKDTVDAIMNLAKGNRAHQEMLTRAIRAIPAGDRNSEGAQKIVAIHKAYARELIGRELGKVLTKATAAVVASASASKKKVNAQANQKEVQASGGVSSPSRPDAKQVARNLEASARKAGKRLSDEEFLDQVVAAQRR